MHADDDKLFTVVEDDNLKSDILFAATVYARQFCKRHRMQYIQRILNHHRRRRRRHHHHHHHLFAQNNTVELNQNTAVKQHKAVVLA